MNKRICPRCGNKDVHRDAFKQWHCNDCDWSGKKLELEDEEYEDEWTSWLVKK